MKLFTFRWKLYVMESFSNVFLFLTCPTVIRKKEASTVQQHFLPFQWLPISIRFLRKLNWTLNQNVYSGYQKHTFIFTHTHKKKSTTLWTNLFQNGHLIGFVDKFCTWNWIRIVEIHLVTIIGFPFVMTVNWNRFISQAFRWYVMAVRYGEARPSR